MGITITATCEGKSKSIECRRPSFKEVRKEYDKINTANPNDENLQEAFRQGIVDNGIWRGKTEKISKNTAENIIQSIKDGQYDDNVWQRYALVGGKPLSEYINYKDFFRFGYVYQDYSNTCAMQVSYALNYGGMPLHTEIKAKEYNSMYGRGEKYLYILGADYIGRYLNDKWGKAEVAIEPKSNDERKLTFNNLQGNTGIAVIKGRHFINQKFSSNFSHTTLWNTNDFVDVQNKTNYNYLLELIWNDSFGNTHIYHSSNFQFWELKD
ncbi:hypothetical protein HCN_p07 (plasmid) [Helicobacter cinaedi PAGU611]|uniref:type VI secretion system amidase effector protein Tae4 n=4 Tax=Helicobacter cinaedi TaxID=213 RepID=UPI000264EBE2|nr:type VI secretion system amidase effector protein Tae4 [Helicobacter cinaedi]BAM13246.1 hypothetical protein HCN_p07 [Helicobacter cinaedi PAGU611]